MALRALGLFIAMCRTCSAGYETLMTSSLMLGGGFLNAGFDIATDLTVF